MVSFTRQFRLAELSRPLLYLSYLAKACFPLQLVKLIPAWQKGGGVKDIIKADVDPGKASARTQHTLCCRHKTEYFEEVNERSSITQQH